ncbi:MAG: hypothetical protein ACXWUH_06635 [Burkholderiales bacterium]
MAGRTAPLLGLVAILLGSPAFAADLAASVARDRALQLEQQQDALDLDLRQALPGRRYDLAPEDARRLEQLQLHQRLDRQLLEQQQLQRDYQLKREAVGAPPGVMERRERTQRQSFAAERELQLQQFALEQQRLLQSMPRAPLQPPAGRPQLRVR